MMIDPVYTSLHRWTYQSPQTSRLRPVSIHAHENMDIRVEQFMKTVVVIPDLG